MKAITYAFLATVLAIGVNGCKNINLPPDPGTPVPAPHNGVFVHETDTLVFNGDGKTIEWHFAQEIPEIGSTGQGQYVFLFGHGMCRYDVAETFRIIATQDQNKSHSFVLVSPASDKKITIQRDDSSGTVTEMFLKVK